MRAIARLDDALLEACENAIQDDLSYDDVISALKDAIGMVEEWKTERQGKNLRNHPEESN